MNETQLYIKERYPRYIQEVDHYLKDYYNKDTVFYIGDQVTKMLKGVHPDNKNIIVPNKTILSVMDSVYESWPRTSYKVLINMVITYIVEAIKTEFDTVKKNNELDIEVIKYTGEFGIKRFSKIKLAEKRPTPFIFNMNY